jgi:hypothetical protein
MAQSYGMTEDEAAEFASPEDFARFTSILDRRLLSMGTPPAVAPTGTPRGAAASPQPPAPAAKPDRTELDLKHYEDAKYDADTLALVKANIELQKELDQLRPAVSQFQQFQAQQSQALRQAQIDAFHDACDGLDESRFGRSSDVDGNPATISTEADANRRKLYETAGNLLRGIEAQARNTGVPSTLPALPVLLRRAEQLAFAEDIRKAERTQFQEKVSRQSRQRRPASGRGRSIMGGPSTETDPVSAILKHPSVQRWSQENGV